MATLQANNVSTRTLSKMGDVWRRAQDGAAQLMKRFDVDSGRPIPVRRKVESVTMAELASGGSAGDGKVQKQRLLSARQIQNLAKTDPITWSILKARRDQISQCHWNIIIDIAKLEKELDIWHDSVAATLNPWGIPAIASYKPQYLDKEVIRYIQAQVDNILNSPEPRASKRAGLRWVFAHIKNYLKDMYEAKVPQYKFVFEQPCTDYPSWDKFVCRVLNDLLMYDAAVIIKNYSEQGKLAELYTRPGHEIFIWRNPDGSVPEPPFRAYTWEQTGVEQAEFNNNELLYILANPQDDGYGFSPIQAAAFVITTSLFAEGYNYEFFRYSNIPPGIVNLGKGVTSEQRRAFAMLWDSEVRTKGGLHKIMFTSGTDDVTYVPLRPYSSKDMQMLEYLKWTMAIKAACFQISPQDIGFVADFHRTTSETQWEISQDRGLRTILELVQNAVNREIMNDEFEAQYARFEYEEATFIDRMRELEMDFKKMEAGLFSRNNVLQKHGDNTIEGGDVIIVDSPRGPVPIQMLDDIAEQMLLQGEEWNAQAEEEQAMRGGSAGERKQLPAPQTEVTLPKNTTKETVNKIMDSLEGEGIVKLDFVEPEGFDIEEAIQKYEETEPKERARLAMKALDYGWKKGLLGGMAGEYGQEAVEEVYGTPTVTDKKAASIVTAAILAAVAQEAFKEPSKAARRAVTRPVGKVSKHVTMAVGSALGKLGRMGKGYVKSGLKFLDVLGFFSKRVPVVGGV